MIKRTRIYVLLMLATMSISSLQSCKDDSGDGGNQPTKSISEYLASEGGYTDFMAALELAGLTGKITGSGGYTILAVSDLQLADDGVDISAMTNAEAVAFIKYHSIDGKKEASDFTSTGYTSSESNTGPNNAKLSIYTEVAGEAVRFNGIAATTNYEATNGMIYLMANSLKVPTLLDQIATNPSLSNYKVGVNLEAATKTALETGNNTAFGINDKEFVAYLNTQNVIRIADLKPSLRRTLINNTLILGDVKSTSQLTGTISTEGDDINAVSGADVTLNGTVKVIRSNVYATNGVLHIINNVLLN
ncbi:MAG: transforming growth factor-beta-induced protein [Bacteroidia bacterium]|jgi:transforming growth factor-beta-induced protein